MQRYSGYSALAASAHSHLIRTAFLAWYGWQPYGILNLKLNSSMYWSRKRIHAMQKQKLQSLLMSTVAGVPYYKNYAEALHSSKDQFEFLRALPIQTKHLLQQRDHFINGTVSMRGIVENHTGGSTGAPVHFYQDKHFRAWRDADKLRCYQMCGYKIGDPWIFLWGSDYDSMQHKGTIGQLIDKIIYNLTWVNTFSVSEEVLAKTIKRIRIHRPKILVAYVSSAKLLANYVQANNISDISFHAIQTSAEVLAPIDREYISSAFSAPVFNRYGCRELGNIAHECASHKKLHILEENNLVEILDKNDQPVAPGKGGRIIVTNLNNFVMPFLRYDTGDIGILSKVPCECGCTLHTLSKVLGRICDSIQTPSGKTLHSEFFTHLFYKLPSIKQFSVIQTSKKHLRILLVPSNGYVRNDTQTFLKEIILAEGDPAFTFSFQELHHIPPCASGKYRFIRNEIPNASLPT